MPMQRTTPVARSFNGPSHRCARLFHQTGVASTEGAGLLRRRASPRSTRRSHLDIRKDTMGLAWLLGASTDEVRRRPSVEFYSDGCGDRPSRPRPSITRGGPMSMRGQPAPRETGGLDVTAKSPRRAEGHVSAWDTNPKQIGALQRNGSRRPQTSPMQQSRAGVSRLF
jgi:hypothetical protein